MSADHLSGRQRLLGLTAAIGCIATAAVALGVSFPLVALLLEQRGHSNLEIAISSAMAPISIFLMSSQVPRLVNRFGLRTFVIMCVLGDVLMMIALWLFQEYYIWLVIRFIMGGNVAGLFVASETWINNLAEDHSRGRVMAIYNLSLSGGFALGPTLLTLLGTDGSGPFLVGATIMLIAIVPIVVAPVQSPRFPGKPAFSIFSYLKVAPTLAAALLLYALVEGGASTFIPVYGRKIGLSDDLAVSGLVLFMIGAMALVFPIGWLSDRMNRRHLLYALMAISALGVSLLPLVVDNDLVRSALFFSMGGTIASIFTIVMAMQGDRFKGADLITANAAFGVLYGIGSLVGQPFIGVSMDLLGPHGFGYALLANFAAFFAVAIYRHASGNAAN